MSQRHLWVEYRKDSKLIGLSLLLPAVEADLTLLDLLLDRLRRSWLEHQCNTEALINSAEWAIAHSITQLIRSAPCLGINLKWLKQDPVLFERLFLFQSGSRPGQIVELHQFDPPETEEWEPGKPITISDLPFPTSGDRQADAIAVNLYQFQAPHGREIYEWLDMQTRVNVLRVLSELNRDPDERIADYLKQIYEENKRSNPEQFEQELFEDW